VATSCGGAKEVVEDVGLLFPLGDVHSLAHGLVHMAGLDAEQRQ
ncbi:glycosyl transferase, group 1 family protein, partial [Pseudomonas syringae pv. japonica str. M301072]